MKTKTILNYNHYEIDRNGKFDLLVETSLRFFESLTVKEYTHSLLLMHDMAKHGATLQRTYDYENIGYSNMYVSTNVYL